MHEEMQKYLDGEMPRSDLSREALLELVDWQFTESCLTQRRAESAPASLVHDIMFALPPERSPLLQRALGWLTTPRTIHVAPWVPATAFAGLAAAFIAVGSRGATPSGAAPVSPGIVRTAANATPTVYVQFELTAKGAQSVSVAGDFNGWSSETGMLRDSDGDGVWSGMVPVSPGTHKYMFIVNGSEWVTDPRADAYVDDGFGMSNAVIGVAPPGTSII